jgi:hypothetical protein
VCRGSVEWHQAVEMLPGVNEPNTGRVLTRRRCYRPLVLYPTTTTTYINTRTSSSQNMRRGAYYSRSQAYEVSHTIASCTASTACADQQLFLSFPALTHVVLVVCMRLLAGRKQLPPVFTVLHSSTLCCLHANGNRAETTTACLSPLCIHSPCGTCGVCMLLLIGCQQLSSGHCRL